MAPSESMKNDIEAESFASRERDSFVLEERKKTGETKKGIFQNMICFLILVFGRLVLLLMLL